MRYIMMMALLICFAGPAQAAEKSFLATIKEKLQNIGKSEEEEAENAQPERVLADPSLYGALEVRSGDFDQPTYSDSKETAPKSAQDAYIDRQLAFINSDAFPEGSFEFDIADEHRKKLNIASDEELLKVLTGLTPEQMDNINREMHRKLYRQDYTDIRLADGRVVPITYTKTGGICPKTNLPNMSVRIHYESLFDWDALSKFIEK